MKESRTKKQPEGDSEISAWVSKSRKLEKKRALQLSKIFEEQDKIAVEGSDDEDTAQHTGKFLCFRIHREVMLRIQPSSLGHLKNLAGLKVLHGLDKVMEGGTVVLTIKDQPILADGDVNEEVDMLENIEIGEQKRRNEAYKAAKKKTGVYDDKFNDDPSLEKKMLPQYDDPAAEEGVTLDEKGRFSGEAEKKLEELRRRLTGVSTNTFEDLTSSGKVSSDYYTHEEMLKFKKPKKKKSLRKKDKLDINALEAEAVSSGLGVGDLGSRNNVRRQAIKEEQERLESKIRSNAYQSAYAKAEEASKLLRQEQTLNVKTEEDETPAFVDDDEDLRKSLEKARRLALKKHEEDGVSGPQAIALLATSNHNNETDGQNPTAGESRENKVVFTEMEEFVWGLHIDEEARKPESEDVFMHDDEEAIVPDEEKTNEAGGWTEVQETNEDEQPNKEDKEEIVPDETIHEVAVGKGLSGALKLLKDRGTLKESIEWGGRNMDKKKSKLVGIVDDDEKEAQKKREIRIERTDEFGRIFVRSWIVYERRKKKKAQGPTVLAVRRVRIQIGFSSRIPNRVVRPVRFGGREIRVMEGKNEGHLNVDLQEIMWMLGNCNRDHEDVSDGSQTSVNDIQRTRREDENVGSRDVERTEGQFNWRKKVEILVFEGVDPLNWINQAECFFELQGVTEEEKVRIAYVSMEGSAGYWYRFWREKAINRTWEGLKCAMIGRFGERNKGLIFERLMTNRQIGTVEEYIRDFEILVGQTSGVIGAQLLGYFLRGL
ncbi:hypothetical protein V8G54_023646 [Vigna mungo]|uniref:Retrotransposon gag domain-containing protein n=1 Tax=Vigna mungo TaxID=3915 RepID=A0AAQ3N533_VIGMU